MGAGRRDFAGPLLATAEDPAVSLDYVAVDGHADRLASMSKEHPSWPFARRSASLAMVRPATGAGRRCRSVLAPRDMQDRPPVTTYSAVGSCRDAASDLAVQIASFPLVHGNVS